MPTRLPTHQPMRFRPRPRRQDDRPSAAARGYCSKAHKAWKRAVHIRDGWQCVDCRRVVTGRQAHADHVVPISAGGERYDVNNGATRCIRCHGRKTRAEQAATLAGEGRVGSQGVRP